jgi:outer membrane receptor protein involved in Fe transport
MNLEKRRVTKGGEVVNFTKTILSAGAVYSVLAISPHVYAQDGTSRSYNLPEQSLSDSLRTVTRTNNLQLVADASSLEGRRAPALVGSYSVEEAVDALLRQSGLSADIDGRTVFIRRPSDAASKPDGGRSSSDDGIVVTGSRIRGTEPISPIVRLTGDEMRQAGQNTLAEAIRTIPQNFNGGQNPGIGLSVPESRGSNVGGGTALNLRGLGADATLTLLNGHRLSYSGAFQSVDLSAIPFMAIDRIEVMTDGASAIYGSDAVAGVANIVLRQSYEGLATSARLSASTDGGNARQQYGALAGHTWASGNLLLAMDWQKATPILARQRDYAASRAPGLTLLPAYRNTSFLLSGKQTLVPDLEFKVDGIYSERSTRLRYALTSAGDYLQSGGEVRNGGSSLSIAPSLTLAMPGDWQIELAGMYSRDRATYANASFSNRANVGLSVGCYCNDAWSVDLQTTGSLIALPAGKVRVALGGGYRDNRMHAYRTTGAPQDIQVSQDNYYGFGEISVPLVSPEQDLGWLHRAEVSAAGRYENYPGVGDVFTPKIAAVAAPTADIDFKASWGKSFRAPTLYMRYNTPYAFYAAARTYGGDATSNDYILLLSGGNPDLKPERATTWTSSVAIHPSWISRARIEISYFHVNYRNRIASPISLVAQALSNPAYAQFVSRAPDGSEIDAAITQNVFTNYTGQPFDPSRVTAIVYNTNRNVSSQTIHGVDVQAEYTADLAPGSWLRLTGNASYLDSRQRVTPLLPQERLAGVLFNPPHFQGRAGAVWGYGKSSLSAFVNYTGGVKDSRVTPVTRLDGMTTIDLAASLRFDGGPAFLHGLDFGVAAQNLLNDKPALRGNTAVYDQPYDPTNYSPVGRVVSLSLRKEW